MDDDVSAEKETPFSTVLLPKAALLSYSSSVSDSIEAGEQSLKENSKDLPLWLMASGRILLENFNPLAQTAHDFLVAIAEPVSRPAFMHEYRLTPYSLFAAVSVGLETMDILSGLDRLSKTTLPKQLVSFIQCCTQSYGKVKIVLKEGRYWIESYHSDVLKILLKDDVIASARDQTHTFSHHDKALLALLDVERASDESQTLAFPIKTDCVEQIKKRCIELDFPLLEEYDYTNDPDSLGVLPISLKPSTQIRPYQEKALGKMFAHGRARSGIIVLPCGAGKTLVGITAASTIKRSTLILCTSGVAVEQWRQQFKQFSTVDDSKLFRFTSDSKELFEGPSGIVVSTYSMIAYSGKRSYDARRAMDIIRRVEWGLVLLDEVHVVPANVFRKVISCVAAHTKLGLTATLVREDDKIEDLNFLIGPKLYEANWQDLADQGHIAQVQCAEVWCEMTPEFYEAYLSEPSRRRRLLYAMNPHKFQACQYLIQYHESRGDKIIVFSDDLYALKSYATKLGKPYICGSTSQADRMSTLFQFQTSSTCNTIFLSKVGDTSIDLPEATCLIQISSHFGSRRQEAQRLGRILRAKRRFDLGFSSYFYTLVSKDTDEMYYSNKRQQFLIDQGYSFKIVTELDGLKSLLNLCYASKAEQKELLTLVSQSIDIAEEEEDETLMLDDFESVSVTRSQGSLKSLSGAAGMAYIETNRPPSMIAKLKRGAKIKRVS